MTLAVTKIADNNPEIPIVSNMKILVFTDKVISAFLLLPLLINNSSISLFSSSVLLL